MHISRNCMNVKCWVAPKIDISSFHHDIFHVSKGTVLVPTISETCRNSVSLGRRQCLSPWNLIEYFGSCLRHRNLSPSCKSSKNYRAREVTSTTDYTVIFFWKAGTSDFRFQNLPTSEVGYHPQWNGTAWTGMHAKNVKDEDDQLLNKYKAGWI